MIRRFLALLLGGAVIVGACSKSSSGGNAGDGGGVDGSTPSGTDGGRTGGGSAPQGCQSTGCATADYCDTTSGTCLAAKACSGSSIDPTGDSSCAYEADPSNPDYCDPSSTNGCYCSNIDGGFCLPVTPFCAPCTSSIQCGNDPANFNPTGACVSYQGASVCLPTHSGAAACPVGYNFGTTTGSCVPSNGTCGVSCSSNSDCGATSAYPICNTATGTCTAACSFNYMAGTSDCPPNQICNVDPSFLTPATNPNFGEGECAVPCNDGGPTCASGTACVQDGQNDGGPFRCRPAPPACIRDQDCPADPSHFTLGYCDLTTLSCVDGCAKDSECQIGYSCQLGVCAQETCTELGGAEVACSRGQFCCGETGSPSCPSGIGVGQCYDPPSPPWCGPADGGSECTDGPIAAPPDNLSRPRPSFCAGGREWNSCDPSIPAQCPADLDCQPSVTFCTADTDCGTSGTCNMMVTLGYNNTMISTSACTCTGGANQCPFGSPCDTDGGYCESNWCLMKWCYP